MTKKGSTAVFTEVELTEEDLMDPDDVAERERAKESAIVPGGWVVRLVGVTAVPTLPWNLTTLPCQAVGWVRARGRG